MSTLQVSNISDGTTTVGTEYVVNGSAKTWANFDGDPLSVRDSLNLSSVTDNGTGDYTPNYTNNFANSDYAVMRGLMVGFSTNWPVATLAFRPVGVNSFNQDAATKTTSAFRMISGNAGAAGLQDSTQVSYNIQGELA